MNKYKKAMRALESLTPSGSEFVDDPERCVAFVRSSRETLMEVLVKTVKALNNLNKVRKKSDDLQKVAKEVLKELENYCDEHDGHYAIRPELQAQLEAALKEEKNA